jgi:hypothetical protein
MVVAIFGPKFLKPKMLDFRPILPEFRIVGETAQKGCTQMFTGSPLWSEAMGIHLQRAILPGLPVPHTATKRGRSALNLMTISGFSEEVNYY